MCNLRYENEDEALRYETAEAYENEDENEAAALRKQKKLFDDCRTVFFDV